jgi:hypothetical protein
MWFFRRPAQRRSVSKGGRKLNPLFADHRMLSSPKVHRAATISFTPDPETLDHHHDHNNAVLTRRHYEVACLAGTGGILRSPHVAPALPMLEFAFSANARGTLILTQTGQIAIENVQPDDRAIIALTYNVPNIYLSLLQGINYISDIGPLAYPHASDETNASGTAA